MVGAAAQPVTRTSTCTTLLPPRLDDLPGAGRPGADRSGPAPHIAERDDRVPHAHRLRGPFLPVLRGPGGVSRDGGAAFGARASGLAAHRTGGASVALRLHFLPAGAVAGHLDSS